VPSAVSARVRAQVPGRELRVVVGLTLLAAILRFATLDVQSLWGDEAATVLLLKRDLGTMLSDLGASESTPPAYYLLAWLWTHVAGTGEVGVRSFSALLGTLTVPVAWLAARPASSRAGLWAAAIAAVNPLTFYYAQEARAYALLILLAGLGFVAFQRAIDDPSRRRLGIWAAISALALTTHYFAVFVIAGEALLLWRALGLRATLVAASPIIVVGLALAPLARRQRADGKSDWIEGTSLASRIGQAPKQFLIGIDGPAELAATALAGLLAATAIALLIAHARDRDLSSERARVQAVRAVVVVAVAMALPLAMSLSGAIDVFNGRNVVAAWIPAMTLVAIGLGTASHRRLADVTGAGLAVVMLLVVAGVITDPAYQRDDNRGIAEALAAAPADRVVLGSVNADLALRLYLPGLQRIRRPTFRTDRLALAAFGGRSASGSRGAAVLPARPPRGFRTERVERTDSYAIAHYRAATPQLVRMTDVEAVLGEGAVAERQRSG